MRCRGTGDVFLAQDANELHVLDLDGDSVTVNGANVLAFEPGLTWDIRRVEGASALSGGAFNMVFTGTGPAGHQRLRHAGGAEHRRGADLRRPAGGGWPGPAACRPGWCARPAPAR
jgi:uncharacterized protein (AIM24 family)